MRAPFSMAVSPPASAVIATAGASAIISNERSSPSNAIMFSSGAAATHAATPSSAAMKLHALTVFTKLSIRSLSPLSKISDRCLTAPNEMPRPVACDTKLASELNSDASPMPAGPRMRATSLLRTSPISMFRPCTPPKMPVYFSTWP